MVDTNSILLGSSGAMHESIKPHKAITAHATIRSTPAKTAPGAYHYIVEYKGSDGSTIDATSANAVTIAAPVIDVGGAFAKFLAKAKSGKPVVETIAVSNVGANVAASGTLSIVAAFLSTSGNPADDGIPVIIKRKVNIRPGKSVRIPLTLKAPAIAGSYTLLMTLNPSAITVATDTDTANNTFTSPTALIVS